LRNQVQDQVQNLQQLQRERDNATNGWRPWRRIGQVKKNPSEVLKLRGEVGALRQEKAIAGSQSA